MIFQRLTKTQILQAGLTANHKRLADIADIEAKAAVYGGIGAHGEFEPERDRLIVETDRLLDELEAEIGAPPSATD